MMKRNFLLMMIFLLVPALSGCFESSVNNARVQNEISQALSGFQSAVEQYDVDGMLAPLANTPAFKLYIVQGGVSAPPKNYTTLKDELDDDYPDQHTWRQPISEPGGKGYVLKLNLGPYSFHNLSDTGGVADQTFEVKESAAGISEETTDTGTITWQAAKTGGTWKVIEMTISFNASSSSGMSYAASRSSSVSRSQFGFGKKSF